MRDYREETRDAIEDYMNDHEYYINFANYDTADDLFNDLYDDMFVSDTVTGNASGSYYCNAYKAKEMVLSDIETVREALVEYDCDKAEIADAFLEERWEWLDVTARCFVLGECLADFIRDSEDDLNKLIEESKQ
jgi:hypothetical protein